MAKRKFQGGVALFATNSVKSARRQIVNQAARLRSSRMSIKGMQNSSCFLTRAGYVTANVNASTALEYGYAWNSQGIGYTINSNTYGSQAWAGASDISSTFDAYRILKVEFTIQFNANNGATQNTDSTTLPFIYVAKDYDDINTTAGSAVEILQRPDCCQVVLGRNSGRTYDYRTTIRPKVAMAAFATTVANGYVEPKAGQWVSTSTGLTGVFTDPWHYGIKFFVDASAMTAGTGTVIGNIRVFSKVFFECKHPY